MENKKVNNLPNKLEKPVLFIDTEVYNEVMFYVKKAENKEVSGFGLIEIIDNEYWVKSAYLLKQECTSGDTELDDEATNELAYRVIKEQVDNGEKNPLTLKWWWHSHHNMNVFWSGTDFNAIAQCGGICKETGNPIKDRWIFATVFNNKGESKSAFFQAVPYMFVDNIETCVADYYQNPNQEIWEKNFSDLVTIKQPKIFMPNWHGKWKNRNDGLITKAIERFNTIDDYDLSDDYFKTSPEELQERNRQVDKEEALERCKQLVKGRILNEILQDEQFDDDEDVIELDDGNYVDSYDLLRSSDGEIIENTFFYDYGLTQDDAVWHLKTKEPQ